MEFRGKLRLKIPAVYNLINEILINLLQSLANLS